MRSYSFNASKDLFLFIDSLVRYLNEATLSGKIHLGFVHFSEQLSEGGAVVIN